MIRMVHSMRGETKVITRPHPTLPFIPRGAASNRLNDLIGSSTLFILMSVCISCVKHRRANPISFMYISFSLFNSIVLSYFFFYSSLSVPISPLYALCSFSPFSSLTSDDNCLSKILP